MAFERKLDRTEYDMHISRRFPCVSLDITPLFTITSALYRHGQSNIVRVNIARISVDRQLSAFVFVVDTDELNDLSFDLVFIFECESGLRIKSDAIVSLRCRLRKMFSNPKYHDFSDSGRFSPIIIN